MLETLFQELNQHHFAGELPPPALRWNARLSSSAGRFCPGSRNPLRPRKPEIEIATYLRDLPDGDLHIRDTMLHEMVHYVLWHRHQPYGHTPEFHRILKRVGARRWNPVPKVRAYKHWYRCPSCAEEFPTRRRLEPGAACAPCCRRWNGGRHSGKFVLVHQAGPSAPLKGAASASASASARPARDPDITPLPVSEILSRLEALKQMVMGRQHK